MKEQIIERLKKSEESLKAFELFRRDPSKSQADKNVVAFAHLFELMSYSAIHELVPDYVPSKDVQIQVAQAFGGTRGHVTVVNGEVKVSPDIHQFLAMGQALKNQKKDG